MATILEKLAAPFHGLVEWQQHVVEERTARLMTADAERRARHAAQVEGILADYVAAEVISPRPYRELSIGEVRFARIPAVEYFHSTGEVRLYNVLPADVLDRAAMIEALATRMDDVPEGEYGDFIDVKPRDMPPIEHGAINLGPAKEFEHVPGSRWVFYLEITFSGREGSFRGGIQTRRYIVNAML
jgi:hypothetical protein